MSENSSIEWTDHTWSPIWTCTQISPACDHCYAKALANRFGYGWNGEGPARLFGDEHWAKPLRWNERAAREGTRPRVFPSMCDPFDKDWPEGLRQRFFALIKETPNLDWLLLTKRIGNAARMIAESIPVGHAQAGSNVWLGATVVNQEEADRDIPKLLATPARVRFLSIEPMLGPIDVREFMWPVHPRWPARYRSPADALADGAEVTYHRQALISADWAAHLLSWVIAGGESGPGARPAHPDWFRSLRDQCAAAGVPFLLKQHGEWIGCETEASCEVFGTTCYPDDGYGVALEDGRRYKVTRAHGSEFVWVGKKAAGRLLDGVQHDGFPTP